MPRYGKEPQEQLFVAEQRAELELLISDYIYVRRRIENVSGEMLFLMAFYLLQLDNMSGFLFSLVKATTKKKGQTDFHQAFLVTIGFIVLITFLVLKYLPKDIKINLYKMVRRSKPDIQLLLTEARALANDPYADLTKINESKEALERLIKANTNFWFRLFLIVGGVVFGYLPQLYYFYLTVTSYTEGDYKKSARNFTRSLLLVDHFKEYFKQFREHRKYQHVALCNAGIVRSLLDDFRENIKIKRGSKNALSYIGVFFKISNFKQPIDERVNNQELKVTYKNVFEALQHCLTVMPSINIFKLDKYCILLSSNVDERINCDFESLEEKFFTYLVYKHKINVLKDKIFRHLEIMVNHLGCEWQATEKKNEQGFPEALYILDTSSLDDRERDIICEGLKAIHKDNYKFINHEIFIEPKIEDGFRNVYKDIGKKLQEKGRAPEIVNIPLAKTVPSASREQIEVFSSGVIKRRNQDTAVELPQPRLSQVTPKVPPVIKWQNGTIFDQSVESRKNPDDITRVIPLTSGRNHIQRYNRFLVIDKKLKDKIGNDALFKKYVDCFWKTAESNENKASKREYQEKHSGRKRGFKFYRDCNNERQTSEWVVKRPGEDPRVFIRVLDDSNPNAILYVADGWDPHPGKK